ncbi:hypothetical protein CPC08DRAFT_710292 [Agrocybe pediades]|nr:hypothetical protein CPC08DRAFT_710292 [Agrocybe pediades]
MDVDQNTTLRSTKTTWVLQTQLDILYAIFETLIEEHEDLRLSVLQHGSQVCTLWRGLLLSSPSLWARSLNFDVLMAKPSWRDEVIRRSGESFAYVTRLGIHGPRLFDRKDELFLGSFILENWKRVKSLKIILPSESVISNLFDISLLQSPHSHLEELEVYQDSICLSDGGSSTRRVFYPIVEPATWKADFGGYAPRLRRYSTVKSFQFPYGASWLAHLRELQVTMVACFIPNVLDGLRNMKHLEHLRLTLVGVCTADPEARAGMTNMVLPRLKCLEVNAIGNTPESVDLVNYIKPAPGCVMYVVIGYRNLLSASDISSIVLALPAFPWNDGEGRRDGKASIEVHGSSLNIGCLTGGHRFLLQGPFEGNLWTPCLQRFAASPSYFLDAKDVELILGKEVVDSIPPADNILARILSNMTPRTSFSTDWTTFSLLRRLSINDELNSDFRKALLALRDLSIRGTQADVNDTEAWVYNVAPAASSTFIPIRIFSVYWHAEDSDDMRIWRLWIGENSEIHTFRYS